jgi:hypothetical protein
MSFQAIFADSVSAKNVFPIYFYFFEKKFRINLKATKSIDSAETQACVVF